MTPRAWARRGLVTLGLVLAVALALSLTWRAVTLIGQGADPTVLSQAEVDAALATERAATPSGPGGTPTTDPTPTPTTEPTSPTPTPGATAPPASAAVVRAWTVTGGQVGVSCEGATITLLYATPSDGWSVDVKRSGPQEVEAEFELGDDDTTVRAVCVGGVPEQQADDGNDDGGAGSSDD